MSAAADDRPTIGERYSSATQTSHLWGWDADLLIAAGLTGDDLPSVLYRLLVEYDRVRADHRAAELTLRIRLAEAARQTDDRPAPPNTEPMPSALTGAQKAAAIMELASGSALTEHRLILFRLRSLRKAKDMFSGFAIDLAEQNRFMQPSHIAVTVSRRVLDVWLRPNCGHCDGRGFNGSVRRGEIQVLCRPCRGSGHRRDSIGENDAERGFASLLLMEINAMLYEAQRDFRTNLLAVSQAWAEIAEQTGVATL